MSRYVRTIAPATLFLALLFATPLFAASDHQQTVLDELNALKQRMAQLEQMLLNEPTSTTAEEESPLQPQAEDAITTATVVENVVEAIKRHGPEFNGALRFGYSFNDFNDQSKEKWGNADFNLFRLGVKGSYGKLSYNARYRWYRDYNFIEFGYLAYQFTDKTEVQFGISMVPFGIMPEASNNFWYGIPYFTGYGTDYDLGLKILHQNGPWNLQLAFYKNEEMGSSSKLERYSYDVLTVAGNDLAANEETNQFNARLTYTFTHGDLGQTELGISGQYGGLYNTITEDMGEHWAGAIHLHGNYGPWGLKLEVVEYDNNPENPEGVGDDVVYIGAFNDAYQVAAEGTIVVADLSYSIPVEWGPINNLKFYNDYSRLIKKESGFEDSQMNTLGCMVTAGDIYAYFDVIMGNNAIYIGGKNNPFAAGEKNADWQTKFNINIGYYF
jgi:hypothetical protein